MRIRALVLMALLVAACTSPSPSASPITTPSVANATPSTLPSAPTASPAAPAAAGWSRGIYLQTIDPTIGFFPSNTRLILVTRALQRSEVHNEIAWVATGPWSPDGTAVVAGDRSGQSYVIWPDNSLTKLPAVGATWTWLDGGILGGTYALNNSGMELVRVDARSGQVLKREMIGSSGAIRSVSPKGDWIAFSTSAPDAPGDAVTASASQRVTSGPRTFPAGWLPDGQFVFVRQAAVSTVEVRDPARPDATVLGRFSDLVQAIAQPSAPVIVVHDLRANQLTTLRGTAQRVVPLQSAYAPGNTLEGISRDGRTLTFSGGNAPVGTLTGTIDLETGAFTYMCTTGCWRLAVN